MCVCVYVCMCVCVCGSPLSCAITASVYYNLKTWSIRNIKWFLHSHCRVACSSWTMQLKLEVVTLFVSITIGPEGASRKGGNT